MVIPCFNRETQIRKAIDSVLCQTYLPHEIIVVDDGSTDNSSKAAAAIDPRVKVIKQENKGAAAARNRGIKASTGDWIAFLDSDDVWHPRKLELQAKVAADFPKSVVIFTDTCTRRGNDLICRSRFDLGGLRENAKLVGEKFLECDRSFFQIMLTQSRVITSAAMVRRDVRRFEFPESIWGAEDWALWLSLILEGNFIGIDEILVTMEAGDDNLTHLSGRGKLLRNDLLVLECLCHDKRLNSKERQATNAALAERCSAAIYHSIIRGESTEARLLLNGKLPNTLTVMQTARYKALCCIPKKVLKKLGVKKVVEAHNQHPRVKQSNK